MSFRILFTCLCIGLITAAAHAEPLSQLQPLSRASLLLDIGHAGKHLIAVGERGHVLIKQQDWQQVPAPTNAQLTKVFFFNDKLGWAVGHDATILHTRDGGLSWQVQHQDPKREKPFFDVFFSTEQEGVAIGAYGLFFRTHDGGVSWQEEFHQELLFEEDVGYLNELKDSDPEAYLIERASLLPHFNRIIPLPDNRLLMVGELGLVAVSSDNGMTFNRTEFDYDGSMFSALVSGDKVYVLGLRGHVFSASLSLDDWQELQLPVESSINGGLANDDGSLYLVGNAGVILRQDANGDMALLARRQGENIVAIDKDDAGTVWMVGTKGVFSLDDIAKK
ncbi:YCF48-related protein [Shewanella sedimentimangrovi]|uniref:Photosynthesis system II assembly factor Ycf48/Hcf136-like domain-containing protein n=1 Tax=Shewanella sedimentimangrovi TaxID=2814293 RepID=A0ABX7QXG0_9GAMM|nr:YCF48-related protein [Shewanella sedimentimangrovi]QSX35722.1 hypothetical protein JYB85_10035 [Shewanella sedimentimangrovi]